PPARLVTPLCPSCPLWMLLTYNFPMKTWVWIASPLVVILAALAVSPGVSAQQDHSYTAEDIQLGSRLYATQCATCHGATGDTIAGVNLRRGQFRRPMGDDDIRMTIT